MLTFLTALWGTAGLGILLYALPGLMAWRWLYGGWPSRWEQWLEAGILAMGIGPVLLLWTGVSLGLQTWPVLIVFLGWAGLVLYFSSTSLNMEPQPSEGSAPEVIPNYAGWVVWSISAVAALLVASTLRWLVLPLPTGLEVPFLPAARDHIKHLVMLTAVYGSGFPPRHPYYPTEPLAYYYLFYGLPGAWARLSGGWVNPAQAWVAHCAWASLLVVSGTACLSWRLWRKAWMMIVTALLVAFVGGLDPLAARWWTPLQSFPSILDEWPFYWDLEISSFPTLLCWVPQHLWAAFLFLFLLVGVADWREAGLKWPQWLVLTILLGSVIGHSLFVALTALAVLALWGAITLAVRMRAWRMVAGWWVAAGSALVVVWPVVCTALTRTSPITWYHRSPHPLPLWETPLYLLMETGVLAFGWWGLWRRWKEHAPVALWLVLAITGVMPFLWIIFVRSLPQNDFCMRTVISSQLVLALAAPYALAQIMALRASMRSALGGLAVVTLAIGLWHGGTEYAWCLKPFRTLEGLPVMEKRATIRCLRWVRDRFQPDAVFWSGDQGLGSGLPVTGSHLTFCSDMPIGMELYLGHNCNVEYITSVIGEMERKGLPAMRACGITHLLLGKDQRPLARSWGLDPDRDLCDHYEDFEVWRVNRLE